ncbi:MAG TPA: hypothetical protein VMX55_14325 [candidate division Zixibacteria bacterium]|nr:hypothetical protein [candidate division Zixibacteria bacterium]
MTLLLDKELKNQLLELSKQNDYKISFSGLIGYIDIEKNEIKIISSIHFNENKNTEAGNILLTLDDINQIRSLNIILPFPLRIVGVVFYQEDEITQFTMNKIIKDLRNISQLAIIGNIRNDSLEFYSTSLDKLVKINFEIQDIKIENLFSLIHTIEFEAKEELLSNIQELKKTIVKEMNNLWNLIKYNKKEDRTIKSILSEKKSLDRIIEIIIPCVEKKLTNKTEIGYIFLAFDLHVNIYPTEKIKNKRLIELNDYFNKALNQDLVIKMQRAYYDSNSRALILPKKIPIKLEGLELNAYLSEETPSKFEYNLAKRLIFHSEIMNKLGVTIQSRILLRDLHSYFSHFKDEEIMKKIIDLLDKISN